ncbi:MAG: aminotransferase class V-fold PLP-dependent enzyme [Acidobacteria bacterium]|nr:aminotransferase class V-fold PLP-dependent enzyme [Acidobacteriota bacterium]
MMQASYERQTGNMDRRNFLKLTGVTAAGGALSMSCQSKPEKLPSIDSSLPDKEFWKTVQDQFVLDPDQVYMNIGTTGAMPQRVLDNFNRYNHVIARHPTGFMDELGWEFGIPGQREKLGKQFGCNLDEISISRNTTDALNTVLFGLPFEKGDEILLTHHEHVSALSPLDVLKDRLGVVLTEVEIPVVDLENPDQVVEAFKKKIADRTRAMVFSHIPYKTGVRLPAKTLCGLARENGLISIVDGAHCPGMIELDFHDMGCDFYAASGHKWQCGPGATGILYVRNHGDDLPELWPQNSCLYSMIAQPVANDRSRIEDISGLFVLRGQENYPALQALIDACDLWEEIGRDRIEIYDCSLSSYLKKRIHTVFGDSAVLFSPDIPEFTSGLTSFNPFQDTGDRKKIEGFVERLAKEGYVIRFTELRLHVEDPKPTFALRISTHLFHDRARVDGLVEAMHVLYRDML